MTSPDSTMSNLALDDFGITLEFVEKAGYGNVDATKISDTHLQNARSAAYRKAKAIHNRREDLLANGFPPPPILNKRLGFYVHMYKECEKEIKRRFMHKDLISIPYSKHVPNQSIAEALMDSPF